MKVSDVAFSFVALHNVTRPRLSSAISSPGFPGAPRTSFGDYVFSFLSGLHTDSGLTGNVQRPLGPS